MKTKTHTPPTLALVIQACDCTPSAHPYSWKAGMQGDSWGPGQHTGPLNEKNDRLSPAILKTHLHPVRFHYGRGPAPELQDSTGAPSAATVPARRLSARPGSPVRRTDDSPASRFFWRLSLPPFSAPATFAVLLAKRRWLSESPKSPLSLFYTIIAPNEHLRASAERIRLAKCWALNKLSAERG